MKKIILIINIFLLFFGQNLLAQNNDSIIVSNAVLHYYIYGEGQPILLLSGGPGDPSKELSDICKHLNKYYQCILFDQRGTGESHTSPMDSTTINLNQAMSDINTLLQTLGIKSITILGHSWGAMLATSYAIKYPGSVNKLILIGPGPLELSDYNILEDNIFSRASKAEKIFMKQTEDSIYNQTTSKELLRKYYKLNARLLFFDVSKFDSVFEVRQKQKRLPKINDRMEGLMMQDLVRINYNLKPEIAKLEIPIFIICGRQDPVGLFQTFTIKELNKNAKIVWIDKCGHFPWIENPKPFYSQLLNCLK